MKTCPLCNQVYQDTCTHVVWDCPTVTRHYAVIGDLFLFTCVCGFSHFGWVSSLNKEYAPNSGLAIHYGQDATVEDHVLSGLAGAAPTFGH